MLRFDVGSFDTGDVHSPDLGEFLDVEQTIVVSAPVVTMPAIGFTVEQSIIADPPKTYTDLDKYKWVSVSVQKSASDAIGSMNLSIDGTYLPTEMDHIEIILPDHNGANRCVFTGIVADPKSSTETGRRYSSVQGYEYGFYLANQSPTDQDFNFPYSYWTPADIVRYQLGDLYGSSWEKTTGIYPYKILNPDTGGGSYTDKDFNFNRSFMKSDVIDEISAYAYMVFHIKAIKLSGDDRYTPCAYWVPADLVDDPSFGLDLPAMDTFYESGPYVKKITVVGKTSEKINRVIVHATSDSGVTYSKTVEDLAVTYGQALPIEHFEENSAYATSALVEARAQYLYDLLSAGGTTISATILKRTDLELYQKIQFSGFTGIPDDVMRIINITYGKSIDGTTVTITATTNLSMAAIKNFDSNQNADAVIETSTIATNNVVKTISSPEIGTVIDVDGNTGYVELESGGVIKVRFV